MTDGHNGRSTSARSSRVRQVAAVVGSVAVLAAMGVGVATTAASVEHGAPLSVVPEPASRAMHAAPALEPAYDIVTASSVTVLVNKRIPLDPATYVPEPLVALGDLDVPSINEHSLREDAANAVREMFAAAAAVGHELDMTSGYRDYDLQKELYDSYTAEQGAPTADETSARPGFSEHQTGLAADISDPEAAPDCILDACFGDTAAGEWLVENSWQYGFILRYPADMEHITGYSYEPWHFRFIGVDAAADFHESGFATYEEFLGAAPAPDYG